MHCREPRKRTRHGCSVQARKPWRRRQQKRGGVFSGKLTIERYEEARLALEQKLTEANERERAHKEKASLEYQKLCRSISARIGDLKRQQSDALRKYKQDKVYLHSLYRDEKIAINGRMHALKMKYLTDNGIEPKKKVADE